MEIYEAKCSYNSVADSVLTFTAGEKFYILGRPNDKWWFAKRIVDNLFGYVPAAYLQPAKEKVIGKLVPNQRRGSKEHDIHLQALAEIHRKVKPLPVLTRSKSCPAHVIEQALGMEPKPRNATSGNSSGSESPPKVRPAHHREAMSPPPSFSSPQARQMRHSQPSQRSSGERHRSDPRRVKSVRERPTFLSDSFPQPDYATSHRVHAKQLDDSYFRYGTNNNIVMAPWSQANRDRKSPSPTDNIHLSQSHDGSSSSVLASRKMITIEDEEDLPDHLQNLPSPPLLSPPPPDYDLDEDTIAVNGKPYHHQLNIPGHPDGERILIPDEDEEVHQIKPKPLINPVLQSKERMNLHRELKQSGRKVLDKPELTKVFRDRQMAEKKKEAEKYQESRRTSMEIKLMERQEMLEKEESKERLAKEGIVEGEEEDALKPEFAKLKLRQTNTTKT